MADQPSIDPRYDPAFQRGFDGPVATGSRAQAASRHTAPYVGSALQRPVPEATAREPFPTVGAPPEPVAAAEAPAPVIVEAPASAVRPPWTNPFIVAVTVLGVVAIASGVWLIQELVHKLEAEDAFSSEADYWLVQAGVFAAPLAIALGAAVVAGVLFVCAGYWARRPAHHIEGD